MKQKIILAGGTGFIGKYLQEKFASEGFDVFIISRNEAHISWSDEAAILKALDGATMLINLAGKSVNCRYTKKNKALILQSRVDTTKKLQSLVEKCVQPPALWVNSSTATIYRHADDRPMDEKTGEIGTGFSVNVAKAWEAAFFEKETSKTRKVALRISIVLGKEGGVMKPYINLVKYGLGGRQGDGRQMFSWIHIEDVYRIIKFIRANESFTGACICAAPNAITNTTFMKSLRVQLKPWLHIASPAPLLKFGAVIIGTETELILKSRWVYPKKLLDAGFIFTYPIIDKALEEIINN